MNSTGMHGPKPIGVFEQRENKESAPLEMELSATVRDPLHGRIPCPGNEYLV